MRPEFYAVCRPFAKMRCAAAQGVPSAHDLGGFGVWSVWSCVAHAGLSVTWSNSNCRALRMEQIGTGYDLSRLVLLMQGRQWLGVAVATGVSTWSKKMREANKGGTEMGLGGIKGRALGQTG